MFVDWLAARWAGLFTGERARDCWHLLMTCYDENGRFYHNLDHLAQVLATIDWLRDVAVDVTAVELAAWFHDAVYNPRRQDNEAASAALAGEWLSALAVPQPRVERVQQLILATRHGQTAVSVDPDVAVLLDADLAVLAADPEQYDHYAQAIRREYAFVDETVYRNGRVHILQHFLQRDHIYYTPPMQPKEPLARANIKREIERLSDRVKR
ncbi:MAG: hypothetical protein Kow0080_04670 [Candidatus Promineifilaceae bacterium]